MKSSTLTFLLASACNVTITPKSDRDAPTHTSAYPQKGASTLIENPEDVCDHNFLQAGETRGTKNCPNLRELSKSKTDYLVMGNCLAFHGAMIHMKGMTEHSIYPYAQGKVEDRIAVKRKEDPMSVQEATQAVIREIIAEEATLGEQFKYRACDAALGK